MTGILTEYYKFITRKQNTESYEWDSEWEIWWSFVSRERRPAATDFRSAPYGARTSTLSVTPATELL